MEQGLKNCFLFKGVDEEKIQKLLENRVKVISFKKGETIFGKENICRVLGIVLSGEVEIYKTLSDGQKLVLNNIAPPQVFGAASLFCENDTAMSEIAASKKCTVAMLGRDDVEDIFRECFKTSVNYLEFMSDRVCFLNRKIDSFTASTPEERLALFLVDSINTNKNSQNSDTVYINGSVSRLAQSLNIGRASLYRAIDALEKEKIIEHTEKAFKITDKKRLYDIAALD